MNLLVLFAASIGLGFIAAMVISTALDAYSLKRANNAYMRGFQDGVRHMAELQARYAKRAHKVAPPLNQKELKQ